MLQNSFRRISPKLQGMVGWCDDMHSTSCYNHCQISIYNTDIYYTIYHECIIKWCSHLHGRHMPGYMHFHLLVDSGHYDLFKEFKPCMI